MAFKAHFVNLCATLRPSWRQLGPLSAICSLKLVKKCPQKAPHRHPGPSKSMVFPRKTWVCNKTQFYDFASQKTLSESPLDPWMVSLRSLLGSCGPSFDPKLAPSWPKVGPCCPLLAPLGPPKSPPTALRSHLNAPRVAQDAPGTPLGEVFGPFLAFSGALFG